jgi:hypothetical protein
MMRKILFTCLIFIFISSIYAFDFRLAKTNQDTAKMYQGLSSNGVTSIEFQGDSTIWFGTGGGLSKTSDFGKTFQGFYTGEETLPYGSITAIDVLDSIIWVAGVYDSIINGNGETIGGGLAVSKNGGITWQYINQPVYDTTDTWELWANDTVRFLPNTTIVSNTTWDLATTEDYTYIVSWAGGLQRTNDFGENWQRVPLPADDIATLGNEHIDFEINPNDPGNGGNHNHKGFSVIAYSDTVWVGTANGINRGIVKDNYIDWTKFNAQNSSISGNFVVALHRQLYKGKETIWAVTLPSDNQGEYQAISKSIDGGLNWSVVLENERAYSISSHDSIVFVSTRSGLYKSNDGENWATYRTPKEIGGDQILDEVVYESQLDTRTGKPIIWVGTSDGIAKKELNQIDWEIYRSVVSTKTQGQPMFYAYPNPFSPTHQNQLNGEGHVRFQYDTEAPSKITLEIFNFAMEKVYKSKSNESAIGDNAVIWNGRTNDGDYVANGTYFCKLTKKSNDNTSTGWTKLIIIK